jgi:TM2 domain-containing membrane protein YozV
MKNKTTAGILALLLGGLGAHKFYLGRVFQGLLYLVFCWTFIPAIIALIEGIGYLTMNDADFNVRYNPGVMPTAWTHAHARATASNELATDLRSLLDLKNAGALTEDEFQVQKQRLLANG